MLYALEAIAIVALYTFFPAIAVYPSEWMRSVWALLKDKAGFGPAKLL